MQDDRGRKAFTLKLLSPLSLERELCTTHPCCEAPRGKMSCSLLTPSFVVLHSAAMCANFLHSNHKKQYMMRFTKLVRRSCQASAQRLVLRAVFPGVLLRCKEADTHLLEFVDLALLLIHEEGCPRHRRIAWRRWLIGGRPTWRMVRVCIVIHAVPAGAPRTPWLVLCANAQNHRPKRRVGCP